MFTVEFGKYDLSWIGNLLRVEVCMNKKFVHVQLRYCMHWSTSKITLFQSFLINLITDDFVSKNTAQF